jgi:hypothetical protein
MESNNMLELNWITRYQVLHTVSTSYILDFGKIQLVPYVNLNQQGE